MLVKKVTFNDFLKEFEDYGRGGQFSYKAKKALYEYLNELAEDLGEPIELDIIDICCNFTEYDNLQQFINDYQLDIDNIEDIEDYTSIIIVDEESFIIQNF